ncbi:MAG: MBL fold metallo-hydrolase [Planctomycetes bacterium]|nr:MBL fold metallo-hydrolase [Planctomycetota bacterium]
MKLRFYGAVRTVTGSMHWLEVNGRRILLDCGLFQGRRKEAFERNRQMPFRPRDIDVLVLSHAHIDHCGNVPSLVRQGFRGPIYATPATCDLAAVLLRDAAHIQEQDVEFVNRIRKREGRKPFEPLYVQGDVERVERQLQAVDYGRAFEVASGVTASFFDAGHILGSASVRLEIRENGHAPSLGFTGDLGRRGLPILRDPSPMPPVDWLISESTYGNRLHPPVEDMEGRLEALVKETFGRGGLVLIPAFSVGRTQNLVYSFHRLIRSGRLPSIPVFVDSPLAVNATEVFSKHPECYDQEMRAILGRGDDPFGRGLVTYIREVEASKALNERKQPCVIVAASGMCEAGRILHHLKHRVEDERNLVLIVGYQAEHTLGKRLVLRLPFVKILGHEYRLKARVEVMNGYSAHADRDGLIEFIGACAGASRGIFLVHGDEGQSLALEQHLEARHIGPVDVPHYGQEFELVIP